MIERVKGEGNNDGSENVGNEIQILTQILLYATGIARSDTPDASEVRLVLNRADPF